MKPNLQHAIERVERPGGSHEGVDGKKEPGDLETRSSYTMQVNQSWFCLKQQTFNATGEPLIGVKSQCVYGPEKEIAAGDL